MGSETHENIPDEDTPVSAPRSGHHVELQLAILDRLDRVFDRARTSSIEVVVEKVFDVLQAQVPESEYFVATLWPQHDPASPQGLITSTRRLFVSTGEVLAAAERILASIGDVPTGSPVVHHDGSVLVPLCVAGGFLGWLGSLAPSPGTPADPAVVTRLEAMLSAAATRLDSELDIYACRLRRSILSGLVNHHLEDYYVERGIHRAADVLIGNDVCTGLYIAYERAVVGEEETDVVAFLQTASGPTPFDQGASRQDWEPGRELPRQVREAIAASGDSYVSQLRRRDLQGLPQPFGCLVYIGRSFDAGARLLFDELTATIDSALVNYHEKRRELGRFLSPTLVRRLLQGDRREIEEHLKPRQQWLALGFADIVGYSRMCTQYSNRPHDLATLLRDWKRSMREIVFRYDAIVDKFIGDCVFYLCGAWSYDPPERMALQAVAIALDLHAATARLGKRLAEYGFPDAAPLALSVGLHLGDNLVVGEIGSEFTAIGADVNIAQRIQDDEFSSGRIVVSKAIREKIEPLLDRLDRADRKVRIGKPTTLTLKGVGAIEVFPLHAFETGV